LVAVPFVVVGEDKRSQGCAVACVATEDFERRILRDGGEGASSGGADTVDGDVL
jgi:hypothetical protein